MVAETSSNVDDTVALPLSGMTTIKIVRNCLKK